MYRKALTSLLLVVLFTGNITLVCGQRSAGEAVAKERLTAEEESEAIEIAERFIKGLEQKADPSFLIGEMYVKDFGARLRDDPNPFIYLARLEPEVVAKASDEELRRLYAASLNFIYSTALLFAVSLYDRKLKGIETDGELPLGELLPQSVLAVLKSDPLMAALIAEDEELERERREEQQDLPEPGAEEASKKETRGEEPEIRSLERLAGFLSTMEKASALLREHLKTAQGPRSLRELTDRLRTPGASDEREDSCEGLCPRLSTLKEEFFGAPAGSRLICLNVMPFHMDLIRVDGRLRILNVYLSDD